MDLLNFKSVLQAAKTMVENGLSVKQIKDFLVTNNINATDEMTKDFVENIDKLKTEKIEVYL